jgi:hypothetical protein
VGQILLLREAALRELDARMRELEEQSREVSEALQRVQRLASGVQQLYASIISEAGRAEVPWFTGEPPAPPAAVTPAAAATPDGEAPAPVAETPLPSANGRKQLYQMERGGRGGLTYAEVVDKEVQEDEFSLEHAWEVIRPLLAPPHPRDWKHSLRRSLNEDKQGRFRPIKGRRTWFRRVKRRPPSPDQEETTVREVQRG